MHMQTDSGLNLTPQFIIGVLPDPLWRSAHARPPADRRCRATLRYWPIVLIALGGWIVAERGLTGRSFPGYVMIGIGSLLLLNSFGVVRVRFWELFWPLVIVFLGTRLIMQTPDRRRERHPPAIDGRVRNPDPRQPSSTSDGTISMMSVLGDSKRANNEKPFRGGEMTAIMGGCQLDLRQASIAPGDRGGDRRVRAHGRRRDLGAERVGRHLGGGPHHGGHGRQAAAAVVRSARHHDGA